MSLYGSFLSDEQFQCSICLDVFNNPASTPCGHSFCLGCISRYWDGAKVCQCPLCKKTFLQRPELQINRTLREITEQFRSMRGGWGVGGGGGGGGWEGGGGGGGGGGGRGGGDGLVPDDLFHKLKKKFPRPLPPTPDTLTYETQTLGSAMTPPLASSVPDDSPLAAMAHGLAPPPPYPGPLTLPSHPTGRRSFTLSGAASSQSAAVCDIHHRGIMMYCRTDGVSICPVCATEQHQDHDTVSAQDEWMETRLRLSLSVQEVQEMIRDRTRKIEEIRTSVHEMTLAVERETAGSVCFLSALVSALQRSQAELMEVMEVSRRAASVQADAHILHLQLELEALRRRESALGELARCDDYTHGLKTYGVLLAPPPCRDWSGVALTSDLGTAPVYRSLGALMDKFQEELRNVEQNGFPALVPEPSPNRTQPRMKRVQEYAVDVTLDCNTAHPRLILSDNMKSVKCGDKHQLLPDNPERFDRVVCVLGREAISTGRHYWEVEVGGKTDWDLGVAKKSINRKGKIEVTPMNGYWFLSLRNKSRYALRTEPSLDVALSLEPNKIGVFVDFDNGQVSFYNVDAKLHIYTFNHSFRESVLPFFSPCTNKSGKNEAPLNITPVHANQ